MNEKGIVQLKLRMREPLRASLEADAAAKNISMNAAMVDRLERSFRDDVVLEALARIEQRVGGTVDQEALRAEFIRNGWYDPVWNPNGRGLRGMGQP